MYYRNLVKDEEQARQERRWIRVAIGAIIFGIAYWWIHKKKG
jgi:hypothetical protein